MGADNQPDIAARRLPQTLNVFRLVGPRVNGDVTCVRVAHEITVGAGAGHGARVGRRQAHHVFQKTYGSVGAPIEVVHDLPVGADQFQLAIRLLVLHITLFAAFQKSGARATGPQRLLGGGDGVQYGGHRGKRLQALQCADGREDDEKVAVLVALQGVHRPHPHRFELLGFIGHGRLPLGHARHQKRHVKAARQIAVGDPVRQHEDFIGSEGQTARRALGNEGLLALQGGDVTRIRH